MFKNKLVERMALFFSFLLVVLYYIFGFEGYYGWDDMEYANLAHQWATGTLTLDNNHFAYRHPIVVLTGLSYKIFGVTDFASSLPAMLLSMILLIMVYWVVNQKDTRMVITSILLTLLMPYFIRYSHKLMSDIYVAVGVFGSFAAIYLYRFRYKQYVFVWSAMSALLMFWAFLTKEVVVLLLPVLFVLIVFDFVKKQYRIFWLWYVVVGSVLLLSYHLYVWKVTGNIWSRYLAIEQNAYLNPCSYEYLPAINTIKRIVYEFWNECLTSGLLWPFLFVLPALFQRNKRRGFNKPETFWATIAIFALLSANFMTKQYNAYSPMCLDMRHYLYLIPIIAVAASPHIVRFFYAARHHWFLLVLFIVFSAIYFIQFESLVKQIFAITVAGILLLVSFRTLLSRPNIRLSTFLLTLFWLLWLAFPAYHMVKNSNLPFKHIKAFIDKHFMHQEDAIVLTDPILKRIADYYMKWDSSRVRFINERSPLIPFRNEANSYFVYHNGLTWWYLSKFHSESMLLWYLKPPYIQLVDSMRGNYLYSVVMPDSIHRPTDTLMFFYNMELSDPYFSYHTTNLDTQVAFSGKYSYLLKEQGFSASFAKKILDFTTSKTSKIEIDFSAWIWMPSKSKVKMVVSLVDTDQKTYFWLGKDVLDLLKPKSSWQKAIFKASFKPQEYPKDVWLKIYLWNDDTHHVWVDDMMIGITRIEHL